MCVLSRTQRLYQRQRVFRLKTFWLRLWKYNTDRRCVCMYVVCMYVCDVCVCVRVCVYVRANVCVLDPSLALSHTHITHTHTHIIRTHTHTHTHRQYLIDSYNKLRDAHRTHTQRYVFQLWCRVYVIVIKHKRAITLNNFGIVHYYYYYYYCCYYCCYYYCCYYYYYCYY